MVQWEELELQALIYRYLVAGSTIPPHLLLFLKKSLVSSPYYYPHPSLMQAGYWGKRAMDPEPGRCRRTDGKKWRCSRDIVPNHKYCERHVHRGRNRSRKPVEFPTPTAAADTDAVLESNGKLSSAFTGDSPGGGAQFMFSSDVASSFDGFQLHTGSEGDSRSDKKTRFNTQHDSTSVDGKSTNNTVLMDFFDDWPRSLHESPRGQTNINPSSTNLSISTPRNQTSDFLRLSTGNVDEVGQDDGRGGAHGNWTGGWGGNPIVSMGGPFAEALRSSSNSSPTSVLH